MNQAFEIPVVLIIFKRIDTTLRIIERMRAVRPARVYIMSDEGRNEEEKGLVRMCREAVEKAIDWDCEVIKNYAEENRGVHAQIGMGARWVFEREETAIFLEDDNLPETTFFEYCRECLEKYKDDREIFWICGTNYLQKCTPRNHASVFASRHLMPCGWASWADKFREYYDYDLHLTDDKNWGKQLKRKYRDKRLFRQQYRSIRSEWSRKQSAERYRSWDFHTVLSTRMNDLLGIAPCCNQIENIGVDDFSTHGGNSMDLVMTKRFCGIESYALSFPLVLPDAKDLDLSFEKKIGKIILYPFKNRMILDLRDLFHVKEGERLREVLLRWLPGRKKGK